MGLGSAGSVISGKGNSSTTNVVSVPCYGTGFRYDYDDTSTALTGVHTSQYLYNGSGKFIGFNMEFDHKDTAIKLIIDSIPLFEFNNGDIEVHSNGQDTLGIMWESNRKMVTFYPRFPICFGTSVDIHAKETSGSHSRESYFVCIVKEA
jgi:hypothetical protein